MLTYTICNQADEELFNKQCAALEKNIHPLEKENILDDVDGSKIQIYHHNGNEIKVINSLYTNDLTIESEIELKQFFN